MASTLRLLLAFALVAAPVSAQVPAESQLTRIGAAAAVAGQVLATAPNTKVGRVVGSGKPIFLNDHVTTNAGGRLQVLLVDETVFTLGPNSDMVLDEFVYDPGTSAGKLAANVVKGTFRFVSGKMSHETGENMKIRTPSGTMGIRGTIAAGEVADDHTTFILAGPGANNTAGETPGRIDVSGGGTTVDIDRPGFGTTVGAGGVPAPPSDMTGKLTQISGQVDAPSGGQGSGGAGLQGPSNAAETAGQTAVNAKQNAGTTQNDLGSSQDASSLVQTANQDNSNHSGVPDGVATFDLIQQSILNGVLTGQDRWSSLSGSYTCSGTGTCSGGGSGSVGGNLVIDWGARTIGGSGSNLAISGKLTDSANINVTSFPSATGPAVFNLTSSNFSNSNFTSATVQLKNAGGVVARDVGISFSYSNTTGDTASGSATGTNRTRLPPQ